MDRTSASHGRHSVAAISAEVDRIGASALHLAGQRTMAVLTNKDTIGHDVAPSFARPRGETWKILGVTATSALGQIRGGVRTGTSLEMHGLPPLSASVLVVPDDAAIFKNGSEAKPRAANGETPASAGLQWRAA